MFVVSGCVSVCNLNNEYTREIGVFVEYERKAETRKVKIGFGASLEMDQSPNNFKNINFQ